MSEILPFVLFLIAFLGIAIYRYLSRRQKLAMNFYWYAEKYPHCYRNKRVSCVHCGCDRVHVRNMMNGWYLREHVCTQCGETLYWSPERQ